jgi:hypothetical protein
LREPRINADLAQFQAIEHVIEDHGTYEFTHRQGARVRNPWRRPTSIVLRRE